MHLRYQPLQTTATGEILVRALVIEQRLHIFSAVTCILVSYYVVFDHLGLHRACFVALLALFCLVPVLLELTFSWQSRHL